MRKAYHVAEDCVNCARVRRLSPRCSSADTQSETACVSRRGQASLAKMNASLDISPSQDPAMLTCEPPPPLTARYERKPRPRVSASTNANPPPMFTEVKATNLPELLLLRYY